MDEKKAKRYVSANPQLLSEWDWEKNVELDPYTITWKSTKKAMWICTECSHSWQSSVANRSNGRGCPRCAEIKRTNSRNQNRITANGSLATRNPSLAKQWHPTRNEGGRLTPFDVSNNSNRNVWWICQNGHEWQARINSRAKGNGCPFCARKRAIRGKNDLQTVNPELALEWNHEKNKELTPSDILPNSSMKAWWKCSKGHEWEAKVSDRHKGKGCPYCSNRKVLIGFNDLFTTNPNLKAEWSFQNNTSTNPLCTTAGSTKKVWWKCRIGHEWEATIESRTRGSGCPYCLGRVATQGVNDLQTVNPALAEEWNYYKNKELDPSSILPNSNKRVWWICKKQHEWQATVYHRNMGQGCPLCKRERRTSFPEYALVFYLKKYGMNPIHLYREKGFELDIYIQSKKIGIEYDGHIWHKDKTNQDIAKNHKCLKAGITLYRLREGLLSLNDSSKDYLVHRYQDNLETILKQVLTEILDTEIDIDIDRDSIAIEQLRERSEKEHSLLSTNPQVAKEWNYEKNGTLRPEHLPPGSDKLVWWQCSKGHVWKAMVSSRRKGHGCPYCSGRYAVKGKNDLASINPALAAEWNSNKNRDLKPEDFTLNSSKKVWWMCSKGHEWQAAIYSRSSGTGCPFCSGNKVLKGYNDLQTVNPSLAKEWNIAKNAGLSPTDVLPNSDKKVWWLCSKGHEWQATIGHRNKGRNCPQCAKQKCKRD